MSTNKKADASTEVKKAPPPKASEDIVSRGIRYVKNDIDEKSTNMPKNR